MKFFPQNNKQPSAVPNSVFWTPMREVCGSIIYLPEEQREKFHKLFLRTRRAVVK
jgi:hypothetical protein